MRTLPLLPSPPRVESPGAPATKTVAFKASRLLIEEADFSRSLDAHAELARRNHYFELLCDMHFELSPVLGQMSARYSEVLRSKFLAKISDTTAATSRQYRYSSLLLRSLVGTSATWKQAS